MINAWFTVILLMVAAPLVAQELSAKRSAESAEPKPEPIHIKGRIPFYFELDIPARRQEISQRKEFIQRIYDVAKVSNDTPWVENASAVHVLAWKAAGATEEGRLDMLRELALAFYERDLKYWDLVHQMELASPEEKNELAKMEELVSDEKEFLSLAMARLSRKNPSDPASERGILKADREHLTRILDAVIQKDRGYYQSASELLASVSFLGAVGDFELDKLLAMKALVKALDDYSNALQEQREAFGKLGDSMGTLSQSLGALQEQLQKTGKTWSEIGESLDKLLEKVTPKEGHNLIKAD